MSPIVILYAAILLLVAVGLWGAYRVLGTPSRLRPVDYAVVLDPNAPNSPTRHTSGSSRVHASFSYIF